MKGVIDGKFIVIEGIDLCGKDTQARLLVDYLYDHPMDQKLKLLSIFATREPSGSPYTREIRALLKQNKDPNEKAIELTELFVRDRRWHLDNQINPVIESGAFVVSSRYMYSTLAFQQTQGIPFEKLLAMHAGMRIPDAVFFIDITAEESMRRKAKRLQRDEEVFERIDFQTRLRRNYLDLRERMPNHPIRIIDGMRPVDEIQSEIRRLVDKLVEDSYSKE